MANFVLTDHINGALFDPPLGEPVYARAASPNRRPHRTADGWIAVLIYTDKHWRAFQELAGQPTWMHDPRYATLEGRAPHIGEIYGTPRGVAPGTHDGRMAGEPSPRRKSRPRR
jgi:crotonobetainyl-CoA:carnitine CoA-transferase CaiB-like acyl-CoA transferase